MSKPYKRGDAKNYYGRVGNVCRSLGTQDFREAKAKLAALIAAHGATKSKADGASFATALDLWLDAQPRDRKNILHAAQLSKALDANRPANEITSELFERTFGNCKAGTYNRHLSVVRAALAILHRRGALDRIPSFQKRSEPAPKYKALTREQWDALLAELPVHLRGLALFSIASGVRLSNATALQWAWVDERAGAILYPAEAMKAKTDHVVPITDTLKRVLSQQKGAHPTHVFTYRANPLQSPKKAFNAAKRRAGLPHITWHWLRHTWASWHKQAGTSDEVLMMLGPWSDTKLVRRYGKLTNQFAAKFAGNAERMLQEPLQPAEQVGKVA